MTTKDLNHLTHECDNILNGYKRHRNPADCAVAEEVVSALKELLRNYTDYCEVVERNNNGGTINDREN